MLTWTSMNWGIGRKVKKDSLHVDLSNWKDLAQLGDTTGAYFDGKIRRSILYTQKKISFLLKDNPQQRGYLQMYYSW